MIDIFYYTASWCQPCQTFGPLVERLSEEVGVRLVKINIDMDFGDEGNSEALNRAVRHDVYIVPMLVKEHDGRVVGKFVGADSEEKTREFLTSAAA